MKIKTLASWQIFIGCILLFSIIMKMIVSEMSSGYVLGSNIEIVLLALFVLLTGFYNLRQKK